MGEGREGELNIEPIAEKKPSRITSHRQLRVYQAAFTSSMTIFELSRRYPREETYSLTDQIRRSSRSVSAAITEAWRKRRYAAAFVSKLSDAETEAAETQTWLEYSVKCGYLDRESAATLYKDDDLIITTLVHMIMHAEDWLLSEPPIIQKRRNQT